jgi:hypothetical protein
MVPYCLNGPGRNDFDGGKSFEDRWALNIETFWALEWQQEKRVPFVSNRFSGPTSSNGPSNGFAPLKIIKSECDKKNRYIGIFMYMRLAAATVIAMDRGCTVGLWEWGAY